MYYKINVDTMIKMYNYIIFTYTVMFYNVCFITRLVQCVYLLCMYVDRYLYWASSCPFSVTCPVWPGRAAGFHGPVKSECHLLVE